MRKHLRSIQFLIAAVGGFGLCWWSPILFGAQEPWDAGGNGYYIGLGVVTGVATAIRVQSIWLPILGAYLGQFAFVGLTEPAWFVLGMVSLFWIGVTPIFVGALIGGLIGLPLAFIPTDQDDSSTEASS